MSSAHILSPSDSCNLRHKKPETGGHNSSKAGLPPQTLSHYQKKQNNLSAIAETRINDSRVINDSKSPASRSVPGLHEERSQLNLTN